jgi:hypothetical protein
MPAAGPAAGLLANPRGPAEAGADRGKDMLRQEHSSSAAPSSSTTRPSRHAAASPTVRGIRCFSIALVRGMACYLNQVLFP